MSYFDYERYFNDSGIGYKTEGKNVTKGWINIQCIFAGCQDTSYHLGIHVNGQTYSCWKCGATGKLPNLLMSLGGIAFQRSKDIIKHYTQSGESPLNAPLRCENRAYDHRDFISPVNDSNNASEGARIDLNDPALNLPLLSNNNGLNVPSRPDLRLKKVINRHCKPLIDYMPKTVANYLRSRRFNPFEIAYKYKLFWGGQIGYYKRRIVIPCTMKGTIVFATALEPVQNSNLKYLHCPEQAKPTQDVEALLPRRHCIYNLDNASSSAVVVEGVTDVWRLGDGAVALFGIKHTDEQAEILSRCFSKITFLFDYENQAIRSAEKIANRLRCLIKHIEVVELRKGDPADLSQAQADELMKELI